MKTPRWSDGRKGLTVSHAKQPATYKKAKGNLVINEDDYTLKWDSLTDDKPPIDLTLGSITNLQATPASSAKIMLKIICTPLEGTTEPQSFMFSYDNRDTLATIRDKLQELVGKIKTRLAEEQQAAVHAANATSAPVAKAKALISIEPKKLLQNLQLQQQLLKEDKDLTRAFTEVVMNGGLPSEEFWSTRIHLLRAFALTSNQRKGPYNVLSTIKPTTGNDNQLNVSLTPEKIHDIFDQYPLVRRVYDENVPPLNQSEFWARFFLSKLFRRLRGEKLSHTDQADPIMDRYLEEASTEGVFSHRTMGAASTTTAVPGIGMGIGMGLNGVNTDASSTIDTNSTTATATVFKEDNNSAIESLMTGQKRAFPEDEIYVPRFLDVEGNTNDDSVKFGNKPDLTMRPGGSGSETVSMIRSMNRLSQRMVYGVQGESIDHRKPSDDKIDNSKIQETILEDLQPEQKASYVKLNINKNMADNHGDSQSQSDNTESQIHPQGKTNNMTHQQSLAYLKAGFPELSHLPDIGRNNIEAIHRASNQIYDTLKLRSSQVGCRINNTLTPLLSTHSGGSSTLELSAAIVQQIQMCHVTSVEFLRHFWIHFKSGDPAQVPLITKLVASLKKSQERIKQAVNSAPSAEEQIKAAHALSILVNAINRALDEYDRAMMAAVAASIPSTSVLATTESMDNDTPSPGPLLN
ncbi:hypothetical protein NADFUDRAFT_50166 [Nadsonia fulvescens var. elongata DSM 6958]|uniref:BSD domain-containing protein n=1 Tax=Nadsonia fulvescens var. elongata DSM 6958 TaxID=857566 RepID=A0A1E3PLE1_9ASCO|nr:hypothetical protein NADFUDRAFT_50166 [Nadsonia fulvescens var. elongata DSM 6958]